MWYPRLDPGTEKGYYREKEKKRGFVKIKPAVKKKKKHLRQTSNPMLPQKELLSLKKVTDATNVHSVN